MSNLYLIERGASNAAKYFTKFRTLLVETNLTEQQLAAARITDNHKDIKILDERTSHVHFTKQDQARNEVVSKMLSQHAGKDIKLGGGGRWCMNALMEHGSTADIDRAMKCGLDTNEFTKRANEFTKRATLCGNIDVAAHVQKAVLRIETNGIEVKQPRAPRM